MFAYRIVEKGLITALVDNTSSFALLKLVQTNFQRKTGNCILAFSNARAAAAPVSRRSPAVLVWPLWLASRLAGWQVPSKRAQHIEDS